MAICILIGGRKMAEMYTLKESYEEHGDSREYEITFIAMPSERLYRIDINEFELTKSHKVLEMF